MCIRDSQETAVLIEIVQIVARAQVQVAYDVSGLGHAHHHASRDSTVNQKV
jgi:hypothetical protein